MSTRPLIPLCIFLCSPRRGRLHAVLRSGVEHQEPRPPDRVGPDVLDRTTHDRVELPGTVADGRLPEGHRLVEMPLEDEHLLRGDRLLPAELVVRASGGDLHQQQLVHDLPGERRGGETPDPRPLVGLGEDAAVGTEPIQRQIGGILIVPKEVEQVEGVLRADVQLLNLEPLGGPDDLNGRSDRELDLQAVVAAALAREDELGRGQEQVIVATIQEGVLVSDPDEADEHHVTGVGVGEVLPLGDLLHVGSVAASESQAKREHESHPSSKDWVERGVM